MSLLPNFELMAEYNQGMNRSVYDAAATLSADELSKNQGAYFDSVIHTLNHVLVGDTIWLQRFAGHKAHCLSLDYVRGLERPAALDAMLYADFSELREQREKMDAMIIAFVSALNDAELALPIQYTNTKGRVLSQRFGFTLQHFFNHQTHHRGQVSTLLSQHGIDVGVTDLLRNIPNIQ
jgi:uncharacterized damage-inducible protein DinB